MSRILLLCIFCFGLSLHSVSQLQINAIGADNLITFDGNVAGVSNGSYAGTGFAPSPAPGELDSDAWKITRIANSSGTVITSNYGDTNTGGDFALGLASSPVTTGGIYAFTGSGLSGRAMGFQPSNNAFAGSLGSSVELRCINNTTQNITELLLSYRFYLRNDENRSSLLSVSINQDFFSGHTNLTKYDVPSLDVTSPASATGTTWSLNVENFLASGLCIRPGEYFYVTWTITDVAGSGSRDEFAMDFINVRANTAVTDLSFYTQNSGEQLQTAGGSLEWSTVPLGNVTFGMSPFISTADYVVQDTHTMTHRGGGSQMSLRNLIVESGGTLIADKFGTEASIVRYLTLFGDITCDGTIGSNTASSYPGAGIGFNLEPGAHVISGSGTFDGSRIRKSDENLLNGLCSVDFDMDVSLHFPGNALFNDRDANIGGMNYFNVTINSGVEVVVDYEVGMDGSNPDFNNGVERGGAYDIFGTLDVGRTFKMRTDNVSLPVSVNVRSNGILRTGRISCASSGAAGHSLLLEGGALLDLTGYTSTAWTNFNPSNNTFNFLPNSTVRYSSNNSQFVLNELEYRNLVLLGTGGTGNRQTQSPNVTSTQLTIREDLTISGNARLIPGSNSILINGAWNNNVGQIGFTEGSSLVIFENLSPGESIINTPGGEIFNDLEIRAGTTLIDCNVDVIQAFDLNAILDLNANNLLIRTPSAMAPVNGSSFEMIISEDSGHLGSMTVNVNSHLPPVDFPFGTVGGQPIYCRFDLNSGNAGQVTMATYATASDNLPRPVFPEAVNNLIGDFGTVADNQNATVDRFWSVTTSGSTVDADLSFSFLQSEMPTSAPYNNVSLIRAQRYDGSVDRWQPSLPSQVVIQNSPISGVHRIDVPSVTNFSPWAAAADGSPLPVELVSFSGKAEDEGIKLDWTTASEINNSHFILSRLGQDGISEQIATVSGVGSSSSTVKYEWLDKEPKDGYNYYQLTQIDFDGTASDEGTIVVLWKNGHGLSILVQSWQEDGLQLLTQGGSERLLLEIFDLNGRLLHNSSITNGVSVTPFVPGQSGIYIARVSDGTEVMSVKLPFTAR